jgi:hypothetical protein
MSSQPPFQFAACAANFGKADLRERVFGLPVVSLGDFQFWRFSQNSAKRDNSVSLPIKFHKSFGEMTAAWKIRFAQPASARRMQIKIRRNFSKTSAGAKKKNEIENKTAIGGWKIPAIKSPAA